ncbi:Uncharacterised protein [uncultured archaeon]|nr:Uncharacterised protein [uncultured archaeon]
MMIPLIKPGPGNSLLAEAALAAFALLIIACPAYSISVEAPAAVPENVSWGFKVVLDPTESWSRATVKVDNASLLDVYSNGTITTDPYNGQFAIKAFLADENTNSTGGLVLYVSHMGLGKGEHSISVSSESGSDSKTVISFTSLDESFGLKAEEKFSEVDSRLSGNDADRNTMWRKIADDSNKVSFLIGKSRYFDSKVSSLSEQLSGAQSIASKIYELQQAQVSGMANKKNDAPAAAFVSLASGAATPMMYLIGVVLVIVIFLFSAQFIRQKMGESSIYAQKDEHGLPLSSGQDSSGQGRFMGLGEGKWKYKEK